MELQAVYVCIGYRYLMTDPWTDRSMCVLAKSCRYLIPYRYPQSCPLSVPLSYPVATCIRRPASSFELSLNKYPIMLSCRQSDPLKLRQARVNQRAGSHSTFASGQRPCDAGRPGPTQI